MTQPNTLHIPDTKTRWTPLLLSVVSHILLLAVILFAISQIPRSTGTEPDRTGEIVLAMVKDGEETKYLQSDESPAEPLAPLASTSISDSPPPAEFQSIQPKNIYGPTPIEFSDSAADIASDSTSSSSDKPYEWSEDDLKLIQSDQKLIKDRRPKGNPTTINVFGSGDLTGRRFVFLIDRSKSMGEQGLGVLKQARVELTRAINALSDNHSFQIVVYHNSTGTLGKRKLLPATQENKARVPEYLQNVMAFGGTNHQRGLYSAMAYDPDIIVMMTDGGSPDLNDGQIDVIRRSASNTQIHTLQFGLGDARTANHFLERLANKTDGTYRYIDVRSWRKK